MDRLARTLLEVLKEHEGQDQAITVGDLQQLVGTSSRQIRRAVASLVTDCRIPIASTVHPPYGFYLITDEADARACLNQYGARIRSLSRRARALKRVVTAQFGLDIQQELAFDAPTPR